MNTFLKLIILHYGLQVDFIPEFIGRFPIITNVNALSKEDLVKILTEPKNAIIKQFKEMLKVDNTNLVFEKDAIEEIANLAIELKTGARGLRNIIETVLIDIMFEAPLNKGEEKMVTVTITSDYVKEQINKKNYKKVI